MITQDQEATIQKGPLTSKDIGKSPLVLKPIYNLYLLSFQRYKKGSISCGLVSIPSCTI